VRGDPRRDPRRPEPHLVWTQESGEDDALRPWGSSPLDGHVHIDELLKHEEDAIGLNRPVFDVFRPELIDALDSVIRMYTTYGRVIGRPTTAVRSLSLASGQDEIGCPSCPSGVSLARE
jgi:hypothetical protein